MDIPRESAGWGTMLAQIDARAGHGGRGSAEERHVVVAGKILVVDADNVGKKLVVACRWIKLTPESLVFSEADVVDIGPVDVVSTEVDVVDVASADVPVCLPGT